MTTYIVNDLYPCIQGEGVQTCVPMALLRLHGCPVACPFCDTKETWDVVEGNEVGALSFALGATPLYVSMTAEAIAAHIHGANPALDWVLLTGGEPAQYDLAPLVAALQQTGRKVALETSGCFPIQDEGLLDWVTVSPKIGMPSGLPIRAEAIARADEIKYVVGRSQDLLKLQSLLRIHEPQAIICLQPMSRSERATELCKTTVMEMGWRLSLQTHKFIGAP